MIADIFLAKKRRGKVIDIGRVSDGMNAIKVLVQGIIVLVISIYDLLYSLHRSQEASPVTKLKINFYKCLRTALVTALEHISYFMKM